MIDYKGREVLCSVRNMEVTFGKGRKAFVAVKGVNFDIYNSASSANPVPVRPRSAAPSSVSTPSPRAKSCSRESASPARSPKRWTRW